MLQQTDGVNRLQLPVRPPFCDAPHLCFTITAVVLGVLATVALTQFHLVGASYYAAAGVVGLSAVAVVMTGTHWVYGKRNRDQNPPPDAPEPEILGSRPPSAVTVNSLEEGDEGEIFQTPTQSPTGSIREAFFIPIDSSTDSEEETVSLFNTPVSNRSATPSPTLPLEEREEIRTERAAPSNTLYRALRWGREQLSQAGMILSQFFRFEEIPTEAMTLQHYREILRNQPPWIVPLQGIKPQEGVPPYDVTCYINGESIPLDITDQNDVNTIAEFGPCASVLCNICAIAETGNSPYTPQQVQNIQRVIALIRKANTKYCFDLPEINGMGRSALFNLLTLFVEGDFGNTRLNITVVPYVNMGTEEYPHGCSSHLMDVIQDEAGKAIAVKLYAQFQLRAATEVLGYLEARMGIDLQNRRGGILTSTVQQEPFQRFLRLEMSDVMHTTQVN